MNKDNIQIAVVKAIELEKQFMQENKEYLESFSYIDRKTGADYRSKFDEAYDNKFKEWLINKLSLQADRIKELENQNKTKNDKIRLLQQQNQGIRKLYDELMDESSHNVFLMEGQG